MATCALVMLVMCCLMSFVYTPNNTMNSEFVINLDDLHESNENDNNLRSSESGTPSISGHNAAHDGYNEQGDNDYDDILAKLQEELDQDIDGVQSSTSSSDSCSSSSSSDEEGSVGDDTDTISDSGSGSGSPTLSRSDTDDLKTESDSSDSLQTFERKRQSGIMGLSKHRQLNHLYEYGNNNEDDNTSSHHGRNTTMVVHKSEHIHSVIPINAISNISTPTQSIPNSAHLLIGSNHDDKPYESPYDGDECNNNGHNTNKTEGSTWVKDNGIFIMIFVFIVCGLVKNIYSIWSWAKIGPIIFYSVYRNGTVDENLFHDSKYKKKIASFALFYALKYKMWKVGAASHIGYWQNYYINLIIQTPNVGPDVNGMIYQYHYTQTASPWVAPDAKILAMYDDLSRAHNNNKWWIVLECMRLTF